MSAPSVTNTVDRGRDLERLPLADLYRAVPVRNQAAREVRMGRGLVVEVPLPEARTRGRLLRWFVPMRSYRRVRIDELGSEILDECNGQTPVHSIIRWFAERHKLTFHEARLLIMLFLKQLMQRGAIAVALEDTT